MNRKTDDNKTQSSKFYHSTYNSFFKALDNFDYHKIALYDKEKITELLQDAGIIRNKLKVRATISNAVAFLKFKMNLVLSVSMHGGL